jgi:hypothetical protein
VATADYAEENTILAQLKFFEWLRPFWGNLESFHEFGNFPLIEYFKQIWQIFMLSIKLQRIVK